MDKYKSINRKTFFKWAGMLLLIPVFKIWHSAVFHDKNFAPSLHTLTVENDLPNGAYFFDLVILIKEDGIISLFSSKCTHLGCRIDKRKNGNLMCPCHGSQFNFNGIPVKGPAAKSLSKIQYEISVNERQTAIKFYI